MPLVDRLLQRGRKASLGIDLSDARPEKLASQERVLPFAEAMYLVMTADHQIAEDEKHALRGALRSLTDGQVRTADIEAMLAKFEVSKREQGYDACLDRVAMALVGDRDDRELALVLAAAMAIADGEYQEAERTAVLDLAERLGIPQKRRDELLGALT